MRRVLGRGGRVVLDLRYATTRSFQHGEVASIISKSAAAQSMVSRGYI